MFAYDFDEPDILKMCESLGSRLRVFLDNAPLHVGKALEVQGCCCGAVLEVTGWL